MKYKEKYEHCLDRMSGGGRLRKDYGSRQEMKECSQGY